MTQNPSAPQGLSPAEVVDRPALKLRQPSIEERRKLVAESLNVGNPPNDARELPDLADPKFDCQLELAVDAIKAYEHNPRRANNARFAEIKESIRSSGIRNPLTVTRRPGEQHFIIEAGGNTRLLAVQQLWHETRDPHFEKLIALFRPWRSEAHVLSAHLIENEQRGDMTFWDKASGMVALKAQLEAEKGRPLSLRQLDEELKAMGLSVSTTTLSQYLFATERLSTLAAAVTDLTGLDVRTLQPRLNLMKRFAQLRAAIAEAELYASVFEPVFSRHVERYRQSGGFNVAELCLACEVAVAQRLGVPVTQIRMELDGLAQASMLPADGVAQPAPGVPGDATVRTANRPVMSDPEAPGGVASLPRDSARTAVLRRLTRQIKRFSTLAGVGDCLRLHDAAPQGYFMAAPAGPGAAGPGRELRQRAWWLLAAASGQLDHEVSISGDDVDEERPASDGEPATARCEQPAAPVLDATFLGWLLDARDEAAGAFWEVAALVRELRATAAEPPAQSGRAAEGNR